LFPQDNNQTRCCDLSRRDRKGQAQAVESLKTTNPGLCCLCHCAKAISYLANAGLSAVSLPVGWRIQQRGQASLSEYWAHLPIILREIKLPFPHDQDIRPTWVLLPFTFRATLPPPQIFDSCHRTVLQEPHNAPGEVFSFTDKDKRLAPEIPKALALVLLQRSLTSPSPNISLRIPRIGICSIARGEVNLRFQGSSRASKVVKLRSCGAASALPVQFETSPTRKSLRASSDYNREEFDRGRSMASWLRGWLRHFRGAQLLEEGRRAKPQTTH